MRSAGADVLKISRTDTKWDGYEYQCTVCEETAGAVATIEHNEECLVGTAGQTDTSGYSSMPGPDADADWITPFADSTVELIQRFIREITWIMTGADERDSDVDTVQSVLDDMKGVRWTAQGSANRVAVGLGRTSPRGEFHLPDRRKVVLKFDPNVRFNDEYTPVSANIDELLTWEQAVDTDTSEFFADIITAAPDGMWLAMEGCIPISLRIRSEMNTRDMIHDGGGEQYIYPLRQALLNAGWENPDYKHANIGLASNGQPVLLDYGTGPDYVPPDADSDTDSDTELENGSA